MYRFTYNKEDFDENNIIKKDVYDLILKHQSMKEKILKNKAYYNGKHDIENRVRASEIGRAHV